MKFIPVQVRRADIRRTPHGVRGLKFKLTTCKPLFGSRTPHGVRGLKYIPTSAIIVLSGVAPLTGCVD